VSEPDRIAKMQLRYVLADGLLGDMGEAQLREIAEDGAIRVRPGMSEDELQAAIRADNAARARAAGVPIDDLPALTAAQARDLAWQLSGERSRRID
jgi:hypothetical protein